MTYKCLKMQMGVWAQSVAYRVLEEIQAWHVNLLSYYLFFLLLAYANWKKKITWCEYFITDKRQNRQKDLLKKLCFIKQDKPSSSNLTHDCDEEQQS